ncbi:MAG TPA: SDR family oxidoreductase [Candidatus Polarisedimenticolia bacterium]|nr:SDR family oxidoreductase [Candidatus Polarisedimenticolia bacterium]
MIVVTGAGGTIGSELVRLLGATEQRFRAVHRSPDKARRAVEQGMDAVAADFARPETLRPALDGAEALFLLSPSGPGQTEREAAAVAEARRAGVRRLVKLSVWGASEESFSFARLHRPVEKEIEASGMTWTFLRPNGFMQNLLLSAESIRTGGTFALPGGEARISHVDARDVAASAAAALTQQGHGRKAYELSGPEALTYGRIAQELSEVLGRPITHRDVSDQEYRDGMRGAGLTAWQADAVLDLIRYYRAGHAARVSPAVRQLTGREATPFAAFARDHAPLFQPEG